MTDPTTIAPTLPASRLAAALHEASAAQERLREAIEASGEGFALWDAEDRLVLCNKRYHDFWPGLGDLVRPGATYMSLLLEVARLGLVEASRADPEAWIKECIAFHEKASGSYTHHFADGRIVQVKNRKTADGGLVTVFSDVSALLHLENARRTQELAESAALLASTVTNIAQGVAVFDAGDKLMTWNRRACELLNLPYYAVYRGMKLRDVVRLMARHRARLDWRDGHAAWDWLNRRRPRAPAQVDVLYPGSSVVEAALRSMPDRGFVVTFTDKTAERQAKRSLEHRREELAAEVKARTRELVQVNQLLQREVRQRRESAEAVEAARAAAVAANQSKTRFLAAASHDLLQPLSAAQLFLSALEDEKADLPASAVRSVEGLSGALHSVEGLLTALLEISKLDGGGIEPDIKNIPLGPMLDEIASSFAGLAAEKGLRFTVLPTTAWTRTDPVLLRRVLQNLINNAVKYTGEGGVLVGVRPDGDEWRIEVWDSGPGISPDEQQLIFEEFRRGSGGEVGSIAGVGLGLAIVRRMVDLLGHQVSLRSERERGTLFRVHVPKAARQALAKRPASNAPKPSFDWQRRLVLLLENDTEIARGMQALFERWRCPLLTAASMEEMAERLQDEEARPDFLIADLELDTATDGLQAAAMLQDIYPGLPTVLVTADRSEETQLRAAAMGIERLAKPVKPAELRAVIEHAWRSGG